MGLKKDDERKLQTAEVRMLHVMGGKTPRDSITNQPISEMTGVEMIKEFKREQRLRWFEHLERMDQKKLQQRQKIL